MAIYKTIVNFDKMYRESSVAPVIINDLPILSESDREANNARIYHEYQNEVFNTTPACRCGHLRKEYLIGVVCPQCNTPVRSILESDLEPQLWMRRPHKVAKFISPGVWIMLRDFLKVKEGNFDVLRYLTDTDYHPKKLPEMASQIHAAGIGRGYNNFVENFDVILRKLMNLPRYNKADRKDRRESLMQVITRYRQNIFSDHLPLINKNLMILETSNSDRYVDHTIPMAVDAVRLLLGIDTGSSPFSGDDVGDRNAGFKKLRARENRVAKMLDMLSDFFLEYFKANVASKPGLARKHLCSSRVNWSARSVITSITKPHKYDEIHVPWGVGVGLMRIHLFNRLSRMGYRPNQIFGMLSAAVVRYDPLIDRLFQQFVAESPEGGLVCWMCRNPSLARSSMQRMRITQFKTDPSDPTIGLPILSTVGFNADFDGDAMGLVLSLDKTMAGLILPLAPHKSAFDISRYRGLSSNNSIPKPVVATISSWLASKSGRTDQSAMAEFAL